MVTPELVGPLLTVTLTAALYTSIPDPTQELALQPAIVFVEEVIFYTTHMVLYTQLKTPNCSKFTSKHCIFVAAERYCQREFEGRCYRYFEFRLSFINAQKLCRSLDLDLISMRNEYENSLIKNFVLDKYRTSDYQDFPWIGLSHDASTSWAEPKWSDTSHVRYIKWASNEPTQKYQV